jgi:hypothetical protein
MKFGSLCYRNNINLGDQIQSLATEQHLPGIDRLFDRDTLSMEHVDEPFLLIMQGWFSMTPKLCFPPSQNITPIFFGFHLANYNGGYEHFLSDEAIGYFKKHEPIGCRDRQTQVLLSDRNIDTYLTGCLTLTFPARECSPVIGKVILVDADKIAVPAALAKGAIKVTHRLPTPIFSEPAKREMASGLIDLYRDKASLVITTRLHCALPCIAMGIPVVFFGQEKDPRFSVLQEVCLPIHRFTTPEDQVDWEPEALHIDPMKKWISDAIEKQIEEKLCSH